MPRNSSGTYTLPVASYVAGTTIKSADMNTNLSDMSTALTQSLATTGVSSMTGPIKLAAGSAAAPSLALAADVTTGWYNSAAGTWTYVTGSTAIVSIAPTGVTATNLTVTNLTVTGSFSVAANRIVGEMVDYGGASAPALWLFCYGQAISRTTYSALFAAIGTAYGVGDGVTTFNVPDLRGRVTIGRDDMGGVAANRITFAVSGITGTTLGSSGGAQSTTLAIGNLPAHTHSVSDPTHTHTYGAASGTQGVSGSGINAYTSSSTFVSGASATGISLGNTGSGTAFSAVMPAQIVNKIIYASV